MENHLIDLLEAIPRTLTDTTYVLVANSETIKLSESLKIFTNSKDFIKDLDSATYQWIYHPQVESRFLLAQLKTEEKVEKSRQGARSLGAKILEQLVAKKVNRAELIFSSQINKELIGIMINSFILSNWEYNLKSENVKKTADFDAFNPVSHIKIKEVVFNYNSSKSLTQDPELNLWIEMANSTNYARCLGNTRGGIAKPSFMEAQVRELIKDRKEIKSLTVIKGKELEEMGMGLFYGVGKGANDEPRCVVVEYQGNPNNSAVEIAFIGKGITFDTGGLNIKGTGSMEDMYMDKAGACNIMGALRGSLNLGIKKNIVFAMAFAENSVDNNSLIPKDILTSLKGLTIEIVNTDAEGRLVLADTMTYVQRKFKPAYLVDMATLTGAIRIALGNETTGLYTNDDEFANKFRNLASSVFEPTWIMPITQEARDCMTGQNSDLNNLGKGSFGGANKAAAFLERFVEEETKWIHLDIAGSNHHMSPKLPFCSGSNGSGTHASIYYLYSSQY